MTLSEIQEQVRKDLKINDLELDIESLRIPSLHSKYLQLLTEHSLLLKKTQGELSVLKRNKWIYYTGRATEDIYKERGDFSIKLKNKDEEKTFIDADNEYRELKGKVDLNFSDIKTNKILLSNLQYLKTVNKAQLGWFIEHRKRAKNISNFLNTIYNDN